MRKEILAGSKFRVFAYVDENGVCEVEQFFQGLGAGSTDAVQIVRRLQSLADGNRIPQEQGHPLEDKFHVVKSSGMTRLIWFYDETERAVIICTHCFRKPAGEKYAIEQKYANGIRESYLEKQRAAVEASKTVTSKTESSQKPKKNKSKNHNKRKK